MEKAHGTVEEAKASLDDRDFGYNVGDYGSVIDKVANVVMTDVIRETVIGSKTLLQNARKIYER